MHRQLLNLVRQVEMIELLLAEGDAQDFRNNFAGSTPLHVAASRTSDEDIIRMQLLLAWADLKVSAHTAAVAARSVAIGGCCRLSVHVMLSSVRCCT